MTSRIGAGAIDVQGFGFISDHAGSRLLFPHARAGRIEGVSGSASYGATTCSFEGLEGRLDTTRWRADTASVEGVWLRDQHGRYELTAERAAHPRGIMLVRGADSNGSSHLELVSPEVSLSTLRIAINGPFELGQAEGAAGEVGSRQRTLRFLDGVSGVLSSTLKVQLDLPVLGVRTLDQDLRVTIQDGAIDFRALEDNLHWLGGAFLDIAHDDCDVKLRWKIPLVGRSRDLLTWPLDPDASALAAFGRVPIRSLTEPRLPAAASGDGTDAKDQRKILTSLALEGIDLALSLLTPGSLDLDSGFIAFGSDGQPGFVDFRLSGAVADKGPGTLRGAMRGADMTLKDLRLGPLEVTADRLALEDVEGLEIGFDGFRPTSVTMVVRRATATNLSLRIPSR